MKDDEKGTTLSRRGFVTAGAGAAGAFLLAACGGGSKNTPKAAQVGDGGKTYTGATVTLSFWNGFTGGDGPFMLELVKRFNSEHKNIVVKNTTVQWADYYAKVPQAVKIGKGPDVGVMHIDQLATNAARKVVIPLDDVAKALDLKENDFASVIWKAGVYKDQRYGIPLDMHPLGFYYNNTLLQAGGASGPPQDRASFEKAIEGVKGKNGVQYPFWMPALWPAHLMFMSLLWQNGGQLYNDDTTEAAFNSDAGVQALEWMKSAQDKGWSPKKVAQDAQYVAFKNGKNAMTWDGIWQINDLKKTSLDWGVAPIPQIFKEKAAWASSHNFVIFNPPGLKKEKVEASKVFINWISEHSADWAKSGQIPARTSVREGAAFKALKEQSALAAQVPYLHFPPSVAGIGDVQGQTMEKGVNAALLGQKSPKAALDEAASKAKQMLEDNAKKYNS